MVTGTDSNYGSAGIIYIFLLGISFKGITFGYIGFGGEPLPYIRRGGRRNGWRGIGFGGGARNIGLRYPSGGVSLRGEECWQNCNLTQ